MARELISSYRSFFITRNFDCLISLSFGGTMRNRKHMAKIKVVIYIIIKLQSYYAIVIFFPEHFNIWSIKINSSLHLHLLSFSDFEKAFCEIFEITSYSGLLLDRKPLPKKPCNIKTQYKCAFRLKVTTPQTSDKAWEWNRNLH